MEENEVIKVIQVMTDYADKQNNQGMKNVLLAALLTVVCTILISIIGFGYKEIASLRGENSSLQNEVNLLKASQELSFEERDRILFRLAERFSGVLPERKEVTVNQSDDVTIDEYQEQPDPGQEAVAGPAPPPPEPLLPVTDKKYEEFRNNMKQRVDDRMPQMQMQEEH